MEARVVLHGGDWFEDNPISGVSIYINGGLCTWTKSAEAFVHKIMELQNYGYTIVWPV